jgi:signal transduction histidine kinase/ActR/RegA family two-component response regulator
VTAGIAEAFERLRRWYSGRRVSSAVVGGVFELAEVIGALHSFDERMTHLCRWTAQLLGCDRSSIFLREGDRMRARFNHGNPADIAALFPAFSLRDDDPLVHRAFAGKSFVVVNDAPDSPDMSRSIATRARIRAIAIAPLFADDGSPLGFITAEYNETHGSFDEIESTLLVGAAKLAQIVIADDASARRRKESDERAQALERRVRDLERLESLGRLSGGVAHDMNNLLTVILGQSDLMRALLGPSEQAIGGLDEISATAERAAALTRQLLAFGRRQVLSPMALDPAVIVRGLGSLLRRLIPESIEIRTSVAPSLGLVFVDRSQLEQMLINLAVNARDAMPNGGKLEFHLQNVDLDAEDARAHPGSHAGRYVSIAVSDSGEGIPPEDLERVFEPFFTTKREGTGLGLATVYGIAKQSGGDIWVTSEVGAGTTFRLHLPRVAASPEVRPPQSSPPDRAPVETVLIVDDDDGVRQVMSKVLAAAGYKVLEASGAEAALDFFDAGSTVDLLVTDVILAAESGPRLAGELRRRKPGLPVLYVSGYSDEAIARHGAFGPDTLFLAKPFGRQQLCTTARECLDRAGERARAAPQHLA